MRIADVLRRKGSTVATVEPDVTVTDLLGELAAHNVGALPVVDGGNLVGIISMRDIMRVWTSDGATSSPTPSSTARCDAGTTA